MLVDSQCGSKRVYQAVVTFLVNVEVSDNSTTCLSASSDELPSVEGETSWVLL